MQSGVRNDFLFEGISVSIVVNSVFESESLEFFVSIQAVFDRLWDLISKVFDKSNQLYQISNWALGSFVQYLSSEDNN